MGAVRGRCLLIVVTIGTKGPFPRLLRALEGYRDAHPGERIWVQHGDSPLPTGMEGVPLTPRDDLLARMKQADVVVSHAGCGALLDAISLGHAPVVVPRLARHGEHVNDHQLELLEALAAAGRIVPCVEEDGLAGAVQEARGRRGAATGGSSRASGLVRALHDDVRTLGGGQRRRRSLALALMQLATPLAPARSHDDGIR